MRYSIALAGLSAQLIGAIKPPIPRPTNPLVGGVDLMGFTPKPTNGPRLDLVRRAPAATSAAAASSGTGSFIGWLAPDNTCGYVEGSLGASKTCDTTQLCGALWYDNIGTAACCDTADAACTFFGNCIGSIGYWSSSLCDAACQQDVNTVKCTEAAYPYCFSYMIPTISVGFYSCASTTLNSFEPFLTTFIGETDGRTWKRIYDTSSGSIFGASTELTSGTNGFSITSASGSSGTSTGTSSPTPASGKKSNAGAIAGGVVGGLVVVGAAAFGIIYLMTRKKPAAGAASTQPAVAAASVPPPGPEMSQQQQQPSQSMYGAPAGYNPNDQHMSMASGYFGQQVAGKQDYAPQPDGNYLAAGKYGLTEAVQAAPGSPNMQPPTSPAPPYAHVPSPVGSPQPQVAELAGGITPAPVPGQMPQQPGYPAATPGIPPQQPGVPPMQGQPGQPQFQPYQPPAELGAQYAIPTQNAQGAPMFEAPADFSHPPQGPPPQQ